MPVPPRLPAEFEPHERTLLCWPTRREIWGRDAAFLHRARLDHAEIARAIAGHEPVTMIASPADAASAAEMCGPTVEVTEIPIDDSWARDSGPIHVIDDGALTIADVTFNGWGGKFHPLADDGALARRWAERTGTPRPPRGQPFVLEGGSITTDGEGTIVTTQQCLLHPNRNPGLTRTLIEAALHERFGTTTTIWLPHGHSLDDDTDGHVDNIAAYVGPGIVMLQGCDDPAEPDHDRLAINRRWIEGAPDALGRPIEVIEIPVLPFAEIDGRRVCVPYLNLYVCNGAVIVPVTGHPADDDMCGLVAAAFAPSGREVVRVPGTVLALGGGGPHCITQQIPKDPVP
jgi:agmatine deiminase